MHHHDLFIKISLALQIYIAMEIKKEQDMIFFMRVI